MNTSKVKEEIKGMIGKSVKIKVNVGRNKYEHYEGIIKSVYPSVFTIETSNFIKSFSYSDVLTKDIQIKISNS